MISKRSAAMISAAHASASIAVHRRLDLRTAAVVVISLDGMRQASRGGGEGDGRCSVGVLEEGKKQSGSEGIACA